MSTRTLLAPALAAAAILLLPTLAHGQDPMSTSAEAKIQDAMSAGPEEITRNAAIMEWPTTEGGQPTELRAGTNDWTCFASTPTAVSRGGIDPMCMDAPSMEFFQAWADQREPNIDQVGIVYMFEGDTGASNTDPFAVQQTTDNDWVVAGPHIMMVVPDPTSLEALPTDAGQGGPWVMWSGTPWAHVMVPVDAGSGSTLRR